MENGLFKTIYRLHRYAGLFVAVHLLVFSLTGIVLLFQDEIQGQGASPVPSELSRFTGDHYQKIATALTDAHPNDRLLAFYPDDHNKNLLQTRLGVDGAIQLRGARRLQFDLTTGAALTEPPTTQDDFFSWTLRLHRELLLGSNGKLYVGFVGVIYLFMLLSGFYIYGKFMRSRSFGALRGQGLGRWLDVHKCLGAATFGWGLVVGLSGVLLAWNGVLIKKFQADALAHLSAQYANRPASDEKAALSQVVDNTLAAKPEWSIGYISFPDTEYGIPGHYLVLLDGATTETARLNELAVVNARTAQVSEIVQLPLYLKAAILSEPLHFGDYGGVPLKVIWALFTLGTLALSTFGLYAFVVKRFFPQRAQQRPPPRLDKKSSRWQKSVYLWPNLLALGTIAGILMPLFGQGWIKTFGVVILFGLLTLASALPSLLRARGGSDD